MLDRRRSVQAPHQLGIDAIGFGREEEILVDLASIAQRKCIERAVLGASIKANTLDSSPKRHHARAYFPEAAASWPVKAQAPRFGVRGYYQRRFAQRAIPHVDSDRFASGDGAKPFPGDVVNFESRELGGSDD